MRQRFDRAFFVPVNWNEAREDDRPLLMQVRRGEATLFMALEG